MSDFNIVLPSKPKIISEKDLTGVYEIDGLYPGYGHTLGNSLRRIVLSSLSGAAITLVKINDVPHEFSTIDGVKEDVVTILLNLKRVRFKVLTDEPQTVTILAKGVKTITAASCKVPGQVEILNPDQHIATLTDKNASLDIELKVQKGLGYVSKENLQNNEKVEIGTIAVDAVFTPIRRVNYEVENMRVGDRTDYNRLKMTIETDGTLTPREALENSIEIMVNQLKAIIGFQEEEVEVPEEKPVKKEDTTERDKKEEIDAEFLKTRVDTLNFSTRTRNALDAANIRTVGGLARKKANDLLAFEGLGEKGLGEIRKALGNFGIILKD